MQGLDPIYLEWRSAQWNVWLEEGKIIEVTRHGRRVGFSCKIVVTAGLFGELSPFAEEVAHGHTFEERLGELFEQFMKARKFATQDHIEFSLPLRHRVKDDKNFLDPKMLRNNADKTLTVIAGKLIDDEGQPALVFTMKVPPKIRPPTA